MSPSTVTFVPTNNLVHFVSMRLEGRVSYLNWSSQIEGSLSIHDLLSFMDGTEPCSEEFLPPIPGKDTLETSPNFILWQKKFQFVLVWMKSTILKNVLSMVYGMRVD